MPTPKIIGILLKDENGEFKFVPIRDDSSNARTEEGIGKIANPPTPRDVRIAKEKEEDFSLEGRLRKHKKKVEEE